VNDGLQYVRCAILQIALNVIFKIGKFEKELSLLQFSLTQYGIGTKRALPNTPFVNNNTTSLFCHVK
jgi:hypothetical protein